MVMAKGCKELVTDVIKTGLCTLCGACTGSCPYLAYYDGRIAQLDNCGRTDEAQCYEYCPRTFTDIDAISQNIFGVPYGDSEMGSAKEIIMAKSNTTGITEKAQYGGSVTELLSVALTEGLIDGAVLTKTSIDKTPEACLADNVDEVLQCAGSSYMACPVLGRYNQISSNDTKKLAIVAMPCQVLSLVKMKAQPPTGRASIGNIKIVIGLFCTWALQPDKFYRFLKANVRLEDINKFDVPPPPANRFDVYTPNGVTSFPLEQIRKFTMPACAYCIDMTSAFADISVGSVEGIEGWNTIIIRTDAGAKLVEMAKRKGRIKTDKFPTSNLEHLKSAALLEKKRALKEIVKLSGSKDDLLYLGLKRELSEKLLS